MGIRRHLRILTHFDFHIKIDSKRPPEKLPNRAKKTLYNLKTIEEWSRQTESKQSLEILRNKGFNSLARRNFGGDVVSHISIRNIGKGNILR